MEDISRELEKEIAQARPKPYKRDPVDRVLIVDDFGRMKSGAYLKLLVRFLSVVSVVCAICAVVLFKLYIDAAKDSRAVKVEYKAAQKKVENLIREKEVLMARLVISGKDPEIMVPKGSTEKIAANGEEQPGPSDVGNKVASVKPEKVEKKPEIPKEKDDAIIAPALNETVETEKGPSESEVDESEHVVAIEKFTVTKDGSNGDLLVRFDIRNNSKVPGDVSGRIFTVLKPEDKSEDQWLVVPSSPLKDGVPSEYRKGQYFSIAHFKPVKFRIKNSAGPDFYKTASIYIFNNKGGLMVEKLIEITEAE